MNYGILFAILSLLFAGINDVIFKKYSRKDRSRGMYIFGVGVIWTALQGITFKLGGIPLVFNSSTITFGLMAGVFLTLSNILLLESFTHLDVSFGSTIYRLNTIGVVILSYFFLNEPFGMFKALGILFGIIGVLLLYKKEGFSGKGSVFLLFCGIAVVASFFRASYGVSTKAGILQNADTNAMLLIISSSWIVGGALYAKFREHRFRFTRKKILYSILSGFLVFAIANFLMLSVKHGQASIVIPVANMSFIVALLFARTLKMEELTLRKMLAIACAVVSIILLSQA